MAWAFEPWPVVAGSESSGDPCVGKLAVVTEWDAFECWVTGRGYLGARVWPGETGAASYPVIAWDRDEAGALAVVVDNPRMGMSADVLWGEAQIDPGGSVVWKCRSDDAACRQLAEGVVEGIAAAILTKPLVLVKGQVYTSVETPPVEDFSEPPNEYQYSVVSSFPARSWHVLADDEVVWRAFEDDCVWYDDEQEIQRAVVTHVAYSDSVAHGGGLLVKDRESGLRFWPECRLSLVERPLTGSAIPEAARLLGEAITFLD